MGGVRMEVHFLCSQTTPKNQNSPSKITHIYMFTLEHSDFGREMFVFKSVPLINHLDILSC